MFLYSDVSGVLIILIATKHAIKTPDQRIVAKFSGFHPRNPQILNIYYIFSPRTWWRWGPLPGHWEEPPVTDGQMPPWACSGSPPLPLRRCRPQPRPGSFSWSEDLSGRYSAARFKYPPKCSLALSGQSCFNLKACYEKLEPAMLCHDWNLSINKSLFCP